MEVFKPAEKQIFAYDNGGGVTLYADPLVSLGKLKTLAVSRGKTLEKWIELANPGLKGGPKADKMNDMELSEAWNAIGVLEDISREAFSLVDYDPVTGGGALAEYALGVLNHFNVWCEKKNRKPVSQPTFTPPTESTSETQPITAM